MGATRPLLSGRWPRAAFHPSLSTFSEWESFPFPTKIETSHFFFGIKRVRPLPPIEGARGTNAFSHERSWRLSLTWRLSFFLMCRGPPEFFFQNLFGARLSVALIVDGFVVEIEVLYPPPSARRRRGADPLFRG